MIIDKLETGMIFNRLYVYGLGELLAEALEIGGIGTLDSVRYLEGTSALYIDDSLLEEKIMTLSEGFKNILIDARRFRLSAVAQRTDEWEFLESLANEQLTEEEIREAAYEILGLFEDKKIDFGDLFSYNGDYTKFKNKIEKVYDSIKKAFEGKKERINSLIEGLIKKAKPYVSEKRKIKIPSIDIEFDETEDLLLKLEKISFAHRQYNDLLSGLNSIENAIMKKVKDNPPILEKISKVKKELEPLNILKKIKDEASVYFNLRRLAIILALLKKFEEKPLKELILPEDKSRITPPLSLVGDLGKFDPTLAGWKTISKKGRKILGTANPIDIIIAIIGTMLTARYQKEGDTYVMIIPSLTGPAIGSRLFRVFSRAYTITYTDDPVISSLKIVLNMITGGVLPDQLDELVERVHGYYVYIYDFTQGRAQPRSFKFVPLENELAFWVRYYKKYLSMAESQDEAIKSLKSWLGRLINENVGKKILGKLRAALTSKEYPILLGEITKIIRQYSETEKIKIVNYKEHIAALESLAY